MHGEDDDLFATAKVLEEAEERLGAVSSTAHDGTPARVRDTILKTLASDPKTDDPVNALVVWTELGRALSTTLDEVGAGRGYIKKLTSAWFEERAAAAHVDLGRWIYRLEPGQRLEPNEIRRITQRVEESLAGALPDLAAAAHHEAGARQALFLAVIKGWFPVGIDLFRALPVGRNAPESEVFGALWAWCLKFLPDDRADGPGTLLRGDA